MGGYLVHYYRNKSFGEGVPSGSLAGPGGSAGDPVGGGPLCLQSVPCSASQPRKVGGVASSRQSPGTGVWSPAWQGPPRVTELCAQIPGG